MSRRKYIGNPLSLFAFQDIITATTGILILVTLILCLSISNLPMLESESPQDLNGMQAELGDLENEIEVLKKSSDRLQQSAGLLVGMANTDLQGSIDSTRKSIEQISRLNSRTSSDLSEATRTLANSTDQKAIQSEQQILQSLLKEIQDRQAELNELNASERVVYNFRKTGSEVPWLLDVAGDRLSVARAGQKAAPKTFEHPSVRQRLADFESWLNQLPPGDRYFVALVRPSGAQLFGAIRTDNSVRNLLDQAGAVIGIDLLSESQVVIDPVTGASF